MIIVTITPTTTAIGTTMTTMLIDELAAMERTLHNDNMPVANSVNIIKDG